MWTMHLAILGLVAVAVGALVWRRARRARAADGRRGWGLSHALGIYVLAGLATWATERLLPGGYPGAWAHAPLRSLAALAATYLGIGVVLAGLVGRWRPWLGRDAGPALLVMAHYDTVDVSPGANDDAAAVAVSLELARALTVAPPPRPVVIAFTGGEELGLLGARRLAALVAAGDLPTIDVAIALDLVGSDGPLVINGAGDLVREPELRWLAAAARSPAPAASARVRRASGPRRDPSHRGASGTRGRPARPRDRAGRGARRGCLAR